MSDASIVPFKRRPCRAWLLEPLDIDFWYARRIGVGQPGQIEHLGSLDYLLAKLEQADNRHGMPILIAPAPRSSTGAA